VIACPCALVISTPVTLVSALTNGARNGVLVKGGRHLETMGSLRAMAFDKTGTLTEGRLKVTDVVSLNGTPEADVLQLVAAIEHRSEHHVAAALVHEARHRDIPYGHIPVRDFEALPGKGVAATIKGIRYFIGNHELSRERKFLSQAAELAAFAFMADGKTILILGVEGSPIGMVALRDSLRKECASSLQDLRRQGIKHLIMLSGDNDEAASRIARDVGVHGWLANLKPEDKVDAVRKLLAEHSTVAMVGDGVNDAPALATATVGIAMGAIGSDTAMETADIVLMGDNLEKLPYLVALGRFTMKIIRQNIALALVLKAAFIILSMAGVATLWMAILADDGAALAVILNGLRVLTFRHSSN
jgi:Cd2+/Zn2+-exporting ATPase